MQYLGGKSRIAKEIASIVAPKGLWWEPFCGGLSVSVQLAKYGPGIVSDANQALISLYQAVRNGWDPPISVSESEWRASRDLPMTNPLKAFAGIGLSFGGSGRAYVPHPRTLKDGTSRNACLQARNSLLRDIPQLDRCRIECASFFDEEPAGIEAVYCDPPYFGTSPYAPTGMPRFDMDHAAFWARCQSMASRGIRVFVSEYACPVTSELAWETSHRTMVGKGQAKGQRRTERLFRILPATSERAA